MNKIAICVSLLITSVILISCDDIFEKDISAEVMVIISPNEGHNFNQGDVLFWWDYMNGADYYQVQIVEPGFDLIEKLVSDTIVEANKFIVNLEAGDYEWRIRACNSAYCTAFFSSKLTISVD